MGMTFRRIDLRQPGMEELLTSPDFIKKFAAARAFRCKHRNAYNNFFTNDHEDSEKKQYAISKSPSHFSTTNIQETTKMQYVISLENIGKQSGHHKSSQDENQGDQETGNSRSEARDESASGCDDDISKVRDESASGCDDDDDFESGPEDQPGSSQLQLASDAMSETGPMTLDPGSEDQPESSQLQPASMSETGPIALDPGSAPQLAACDRWLLVLVLTWVTAQRNVSATQY